MKALIVATFLFIAANSFGASFLPQNDMYISVDDKSAGGITEVQFNDVINKIEDVYKPVIEGMGKKLVIERNWTDGTVNAYASQSGNVYTIAMFGGLARSKEVSYEGFALVVCHEMGHHLGGTPFWDRSPWAAAEGQADYYSTLKCFKRAFRKEAKRIDVEAAVTDLCSKVYTKEEDVFLCERGISGGQSLATLLASLGGDRLPSILTPDTRIVTKTLTNGYPPVQSRLDNYVAGALCDVSEFIDTSRTDQTQGVCNTGIGARPRSWFAPRVAK